MAKRDHYDGKPEDPCDINKPQRSPDELRRALEESARQQKALKAAKKSADDDFNGRIKELDLEIASILDQLKG